MIGKAPIICDVCGAVKGEGNRWLMGWENCNEIAISTDTTTPRFRRDWCSEKCLHIAVSRHIEKIRAAQE